MYNMYDLLSCMLEYTAQEQTYMSLVSKESFMLSDDCALQGKRRLSWDFASATLIVLCGKPQSIRKGSF